VTDPAPLFETDSKGYLKIAVIRGVAVYVHWSLPAGGAMVACLGGVDLARWIYYCVGYSILVVVHESGHMLAAVAVGLKVYSIHIAGVGGVCRFERPKGVWAGFFVVSGGLLAQATLLLMSIAYVHTFGTPSGNFGRAMLNTFTLVNVALFALNLIPSRSRWSGRATDGLLLWKLLLHVFLGHPHPMPPVTVKSAEEAPIFPSETRLLEKAGFRPDGFIQGIEILNDKTTPMEFVVSTLRNHLGLSERDALLRMIEVHNKGGALIAISARQEAIRIADAISAQARAAGHSLICRYAGD